MLILAVVFATAAFKGLSVSGQEMWGISMSNFAGSSGTMLNPTSILASKLYMDVNLLTADLFVQNNYVYIHNEDYRLKNFIKKDPVFPKYGPDELAVDRYAKTDFKNAYIQVLAKGPSFMIARGRHAFAVHTGARYLTSINHLSYDIANFGYFGIDYAEQHNINYIDKHARAAFIGMIEAGVSYAYAVRKYGMDEWIAGITLKGLFSPGGGYVYADEIDYIMVNDSTANIRNLRAEAGVSIPIDYDDYNDPYPDDGPFIKGIGGGIDIGVTYNRKVLSYQRKRIKSLCSQPYVDYIYKVGLSIIDIGAVKFTKNTMVHSFDNVSDYWINIDTINYRGLNNLFGTLSGVLYDDPAASYRRDYMTIYLPMAASVQFDYKVYHNFYAGGVFIHPIPLSKAMIVRPTQLAVVPRYETPRLELALPVSLYNWKYPRVGLSIRYEIFTIGTDKLASFFGVSDFTGMDIYFMIKLNFRKGNCRLGSGLVECKNGEYGLERKVKLRKD